MENDANEDLIEDTIRRVAAQKAALASRAHAADDAGPPARSAADALIEDTIRRVAAQKAALAASAPADDDPPPPSEASDTLIEDTIRRVAAQKAALDAQDPGADDAAAAEANDAPVASTESADAANDLIEATIRRVQAEKAAREAADDDAPAPDQEAAAAAPPPQALPRRLAVAGARDSDEANRPSEPSRPSLRAFAPSSHYEPGPPPADWNGGSASSDPALARIEQGLAETARAVQQIAARLDALAPLIERLSGAPVTLQPRRDASQDDDDWDDVPVLPRLSGMPPRPSILRDPSPHTATAAQLEPEVIDTRPLPQPLPPIHTDTRRGFDLLPRTYRVTVEDKRRGVDLVPLHRALLGMEGVNDMSLLSYNNGVAIVALETVADLDPEELRLCVSRAMSREAKVEVHNERTMVIKLAED